MKFSADEFCAIMDGKHNIRKIYVIAIVDQGYSRSFISVMKRRVTRWKPTKMEEKIRTIPTMIKIPSKS